MHVCLQVRLPVFSVYVVHWLNIDCVCMCEREMATWGLSSLVSVAMSQ